MEHVKRILFIDAYDSFSNNVISLLETSLGYCVAVDVVHMDLTTCSSDLESQWTASEFTSRLASYDAVVCGPGPGTPDDAKDVGAFRLLWELCDEHMLPVLGICLGFQSMVSAFGGKIRRLQQGLHGMVRNIDHCGADAPSSDIFSAVGPFRATLYHSLCVHVGQDGVPEAEWSQRRWTPSDLAPDIVPLAWTTEPRIEGDERILMAARHVTKPFWGLQYHPESVCTDGTAHQVLVNWFREALKWNATTGRVRAAACESTSKNVNGLKFSSHGSGRAQTLDNSSANGYHNKTLNLPNSVKVTGIVDALESAAQEAAVLDSSSAHNGDPLARYSIIALDTESAPKFEYRVDDDFLTVRYPHKTERISLSESSRKPGDAPDAIWHALTAYWQTQTVGDVDPGSPTVPFRGGFMGFVTYEAGLSSLRVQPIDKNRQHRRPDICLAWIRKSAVVNHKTRQLHLQALGTQAESESWLEATAERLMSSTQWALDDSVHANGVPKGAARKNEQLLDLVRSAGFASKYRVPDSTEYEHKVEICQDFIRAGDSYEICLTGQTDMLRSTQTSITDWAMYKLLRSRQPAPFGSFIKLGGATLLSSSPERFFEHDADGNCTMRPMKGTVRKSEAVSTLEQAEKILHCPKEEAENLMIVDLVRHDLHGVCGAGKVFVPDLLKVEEYATVFTMITVVAGQLAGLQDESKKGSSGLQALGAMLPPGSMTGAPKKRSCEILRDLERRERSLYSGVVGYFDVTGQADWSVTIRSMFRWDDEMSPQQAHSETDKEKEVWHIGAGGAVTILSTSVGEREEMLTKLCGPLGVFVDSTSGS